MDDKEIISTADGELDLTPRIDNPLVPVFDFVYNSDHVLEVKQTGVKDVDAEIQSYADSCGIEYVLKCLQAGDTSVLTAAGAGTYGDFTRAPMSIAEARHNVDLAVNDAKTLPAEVVEGRSLEQVAALSADDIKSLIEKAVADKLSASKESTTDNG